ncbi:hypothetical protein K7W42_22100 [Deinococcus sp. HMF7604]|uniref:hypothetical protein n=1 Tax=Deinococcus betulae TaxID=2873312 RepID=UPI001CCE3710|nr:hypothetical protein [Deinococcus betulae]MBZ9753528.1 hypothetical protein [Deinococcus betulae]
MIRGWWLAPLLLGAFRTKVLRFPTAGWTPTDERDGVGPLTRREYWIDLAAPQRSGPEVIQLMLQQLPSLTPPALAWFRRVRPTEGPTGVGDQFKILMLGSRRARVEVAFLAPDHFRLRTLKQHSESGWTEFRCSALSTEGYRLSILSQVRASSWLDRLGYLLGIGILQRLTWEAALRRALQLSGGRKVGHGVATSEWP